MIRQNSHDPKMLCKSLNAIMYKTKENPLPPPPHTSAKQLANDFNNLFKSKMDQIRENFGDNTIDPYEHYNQFNDIVLEKFAPVQIEDIIQIIKKSPSKTCSMDPIPTDLLKQCSAEPTPILTRIVNLSLVSGIFPSI